MHDFGKSKKRKSRIYISIGAEKIMNFNKNADAFFYGLWYTVEKRNRILDTA